MHMQIYMYINLEIYSIYYAYNASAIQTHVYKFAYNTCIYTYIDIFYVYNIKFIYVTYNILTYHIVCMNLNIWFTSHICLHIVYITYV